MKKKNPPQKRIFGKSRRFFLVFCAGALLSSLFLSVSLALTYDISPALDEALFQKAGEDTATHLYYYDGDEILEWREERVTSGGLCTPVSIERMPKDLKNAFVAMEDHRFYRHAGVDVFRTAKAALNINGTWRAKVTAAVATEEDVQTHADKLALSTRKSSTRRRRRHRKPSAAQNAAKSGESNG